MTDSGDTEALAATCGEPSPRSVDRMVLPLDRALTRWSVACASWSELAAGSAPLLQAYLAGWMCRCCGTSRPQHEGDYRDSFRRGWADAETEIIIAKRQNGESSDGGR